MQHWQLSPAKVIPVYPEILLRCAFKVKSTCKATSMVWRTTNQYAVFIIVELAVLLDFVIQRQLEMKSKTRRCMKVLP